MPVSCESGAIKSLTKKDKAFSSAPCRGYMGPGSKPQLALDTNVLFDLADGKDFAGTVLEFLTEQKAAIKVPPTVMVELEYEISSQISPQKAKRAERAFQAIASWKMTPINLASAQRAVVREFSKTLQHAGVIPHDEFNAGCILAETALSCLDFLLTSDTHLLSIHRQRLNELFDEKSLYRVEAVSPRRLYSQLKRR